MTAVTRSEALDYFRTHAVEWRQWAEGRETEVNVIEQRNAHVIAVAERIGRVARAIDLGCGTGELVCDLAARGVDALGVDFAPEMIALARGLAERRGLDRARFVEGSVFDVVLPDRGADLVAANGLIEYLAKDDVPRSFDLARRILKPGGSLVVGSRNRLFNLTSLNEHTRLEIDLGELEHLALEAIDIESARDQSDMIDALSRRDVAAPFPHVAQPRTGIDVRVRWQFTPGQLVQMGRAHGFRAVDVAPIHIHAVPPALKAEQPRTHVALATLLQGESGTASHRLIPQASTFMLHAVRED